MENSTPKSHDLLDALHIFVLFSFAVAQPVFDVLSRNVEFFVAHDSQPVDVTVLILILIILLPTLVVLIESAAGLFNQNARKATHLMFLTGLMTLISLPVLKNIGGVPGIVLVMVAIIFGIISAIIYVRLLSVRMFVTFLSPAILIFPGLFLFNSQVSKVMFPQRTANSPSSEITATIPIVMVVF